MQKQNGLPLEPFLNVTYQTETRTRSLHCKFR